MLSYIQKLFSIFLWYGVVVAVVATAIFTLPMHNPLGVVLLESLIQLFSGFGISFVVLNPADGFLVQIYIAIGLALFLGIPYLVGELYGFIAPGLYPKEKRFFIIVAGVSTLLFLAGATFGLVIVAPPSLKILEGFNAALSLSALYPLRNFIGDLFGLVFFSGVAFTLPVAMVLLSRFKLVDPTVWFSAWRYVVLLVLLISAIITPDGTGVTMALFAAPIIALYFAGASFSYIVRPRT